MLHIAQLTGELRLENLKECAHDEPAMILGSAWARRETGQPLFLRRTGIEHCTIKPSLENPAFLPKSLSGTVQISSDL